MNAILENTGNTTVTAVNILNKVNELGGQHGGGQHYRVWQVTDAIENNTFSDNNNKLFGTRFGSSIYSDAGFTWSDKPPYNDRTYSFGVVTTGGELVRVKDLTAAQARALGDEFARVARVPRLGGKLVAAFA